jgi:hypothetical protein
VPVRAFIVFFVAAAVLAACGGGSSTKVSPTTAAATTTQTSSPSGRNYDHVVWVWMENHTYRQVIGNSAAPYETALAHQFGTATNYASVGSPSLPNYIGATSGSTQAIADDGSPASHPLTVDNLFRQVRAAGGTERSFQESMPANCLLGAVDPYAVKHNPAAYYTGGDDRAACRSDDVPFSGTLPSGTLPRFSFVTPNLCNDTHDCSVAAGDAWLKSFLPPLLAGADYRAGTTVIFVVWDEYTPMPNIVISPTTPAGTVSSARFDQYSLLRTTEEVLGLPLLGRASSATSMRAAFRL